MGPETCRDADLVADVLAGDRAAYGHFYDRYAPAGFRMFDGDLRTVILPLVEWSKLVPEDVAAPFHVDESEAGD